MGRFDCTLVHVTQSVNRFNCLYRDMKTLHLPKMRHLIGLHISINKYGKPIFHNPADILPSNPVQRHSLSTHQPMSDNHLLSRTIQINTEHSLLFYVNKVETVV